VVKHWRYDSSDFRCWRRVSQLALVWDTKGELDTSALQASLARWPTRSKGFSALRNTVVEVANVVGCVGVVVSGLRGARIVLIVPGGTHKMP
jgi:hypothetical protein